MTSHTNDNRDPRDRVPPHDGGHHFDVLDNQGQATSPVDSQHVDAPTEQKNARGHKQVPQRDET